MKASEFTTSNYLNAATAQALAGKTYVIFEVTAETIRDKRKMVMGLEGVDKAIVMNKTNREILAEAYGDETNDWIGKTVQLDIVKVMFEGKRTSSIALTPVTTAAPPASDPIIDAEHAAPLPKKARK